MSILIWRLWVQKLFTVVYDTGSSDLFLPDSNCGRGCGGHTLYNSSASSTSKALGKKFRFFYRGRSIVSGNLYNDTVEIAGLTATSQTLGSVRNTSTSFTQTPLTSLLQATKYVDEFRRYDIQVDL
jgi:hypothetical protein